MIVPCSFNIIGMFFENTELWAMGKLWTFLVVAPVDGVAKRRGHSDLNGWRTSLAGNRAWHVWPRVIALYVTSRSLSRSSQKKLLSPFSSWKFISVLNTWTFIQDEFPAFPTGRARNASASTPSPYAAPGNNHEYQWSAPKSPRFCLTICRTDGK